MPAERSFVVIRAALLILLSGLVLAGCGGDDENTASGPKVDDAGPIHVHGLGVNPSDGSLYIATHTGLFRTAEGTRTSSRIADRWQDTMGFAVVGPNRFLGSGHPDFQKDGDLPPLLGLIGSNDAGETWKSVSLLGKADFHVLESSGSRIYGYDSSGDRLMVSADAGKSWDERRTPESLLSLAIDPADSLHVVASGERSMYASVNGGRTWKKLASKAGLLAWPAENRLYVIEADGAVLLSDNGGADWSASGDLEEQPGAFEAEGSRDLYAALHDGTVKRSIDGGATWEVRARP